MVDDGTFREDLYYRLNVIQLQIPRLSDRREDIYPLMESILKRMNNKYQMNKQFSDELKGFLYQYNWPGNIRELSNLVERLVIVSKNYTITINDLPQEYHSAQQNMELPQASLTLKEAIEMAEKQVIMQALNKCSTTYELAEILQTSQPTISRKLKKYGIKLIH